MNLWKPLLHVITTFSVWSCQRFTAIKPSAVWILICSCSYGTGAWTLRGFGKTCSYNFPHYTYQIKMIIFHKWFIFHQGNPMMIFEFIFLLQAQWLFAQNLICSFALYDCTVMPAVKADAYLLTWKNSSRVNHTRICGFKFQVKSLLCAWFGADLWLQRGEVFTFACSYAKHTVLASPSTTPLKAKTVIKC